MWFGNSNKEYETIKSEKIVSLDDYKKLKKEIKMGYTPVSPKVVLTEMPCNTKYGLKYVVTARSVFLNEDLEAIGRISNAERRNVQTGKMEKAYSESEVGRQVVLYCLESWNLVNVEDGSPIPLDSAALAKLEIEDFLYLQEHMERLIAVLQNRVAKKDDAEPKTLITDSEKK